jgi:hypothetical protein
VLHQKATGLTAMSTTIHTPSYHKLKDFHVAHTLDSMQRQELALEVIGNKTSVTKVASHLGVSRKFVYQQKDIALNGVTEAFSASSSDDSTVCFHLPVTKEWIKQFILSLVLISHSSYQGVIELLRDLFDYDISKGNVHNIVHAALAQATQINRQQDLSQIKVGAHDEIYQAQDPVLVGCDAHSTYCYLLSLEEHCDANAWGIHLLELQEKQGLKPDHTIADGGRMARSGQREAWPNIPCHGDVFHALKPFSDLLSYVDNRAVESLKMVEEIKHKLNHPWGKTRKEEKRKELFEKMTVVEEMSEKALCLSEDLTTLYRWLQKDILCLAGPTYNDRLELLDFVVNELRLREPANPHRIGPVRKYLEINRDNLLAFVPLLEERLKKIADRHKTPLEGVVAIHHLAAIPASYQKHWEQYADLYQRLGSKFYRIKEEVDQLLNNVVRASSVVENLNSRLRNYFSLRRHLGKDYLEILRFFLNHRRFMRSEHEERIGKSPAELMSGKNHPHWLEMLGFSLFKQAA